MASKRITPGATALLTLAGVLGILAAINRYIASTAHDTFSVLSGESRRYAWVEGNVFYKVQGQGAPLVLVHGIYAGASGFEWRKNFDALSAHFRVYAPDLVGFGLSSRPPIHYRAQTYVQLLLDFVREVAGGADHPVSVVASSLSAAHLIQAAAQYPQLFARLVLIEPTGIYELNQPPNLAQRLAYRLLRTPILGSSVYHAITSRAGIRSFLTRQAYLRPEAVTTDLVEYYFQTTHQPGGKYAPLSFITGYLNLNIEEAFARLPHPLLIVWGREATITPVEDAYTFQRLNPHARLEILDGCAMLPQEEQAEQFNDLIVSWLREEAPTRR